MSYKDLEKFVPKRKAPRFKTTNDDTEHKSIQMELYDLEKKHREEQQPLQDAIAEAQDALYAVLDRQKKERHYLEERQHAIKSYVTGSPSYQDALHTWRTQVLEEACRASGLNKLSFYCLVRMVEASVSADILDDSSEDQHEYLTTIKEIADLMRYAQDTM